MKWPWPTDPKRQWFNIYIAISIVAAGAMAFHFLFSH